MKYLFTIVSLVLVSNVSFASSQENVRFSFQDYAHTSQGDVGKFYRQNGDSFCLWMDKTGGMASAPSDCNGFTFVWEVDLAGWGASSATDVQETFLYTIELSGYSGDLEITDNFNNTMEVKNLVAGPVTDATATGSVSATVLTQGN